MELAVPRTFQRRVVSRKFQGSIENGIDLRRSLRSLLRGVPQLYVRCAVGKLPSAVDPGEPLVWLFPDAPPQSLFMIWGPRPETYVTFLTSDAPPEQLYPRLDGGNPYASSPETGRAVNKCVLGGLVSFVQWEQNTYILKRLYASDFAARVPSGEAFEFLEPWGFVHRNLFQSVESEGQVMWRDVLILTALAYAGRDVYVVAPDDFELSARLRRAATRLDRNLITIPIQLFDSNDIDQLRTRYTVSADPVESDAPEAVAPVLDLRARFGDLMKQLGIA
jgi:hypothetical protein